MIDRRLGSEAGSVPGRAAALLVVLVLLAELAVLYPGVLRGDVVSSAALAYGMAPWRGQVPVGVEVRGNPVLSDDMALFVPWDAAVTDSLADGAMPFWNRWSGCGMPLLANNQSAVLAPTQALRWFWHSPRARTLGNLLKVILAGLAVFVLLRVWGVPAAGAAIGGLAWANAAAMSVWLLYPIAETAAWFPLVVAGAAIVLRGEGREGVRGQLVLAVSLAAMLLAGHLPTAVQLLSGGALVLAVWVVLARPAPRLLARLLVPSVIAVLLALPQALPTWAYLRVSEAVQVRQAAATAHLPVVAAWSWLVPRGFGSPERFGYDGPINFNEATASVGVTALLLALLALAVRRDRLVVGLALATGVALAAAYGMPPLPAIIARLPVLRWAAGLRWIVPAQIGVACLAGVAAAHLPALRGRRHTLALAGIVAVLLAAISLHPGLAAPPGPQASAAAAEIALAALELVLSAFAVILASRTRRAGAAVLACLVVVSGLRLALGFNPTVPLEALPGPTVETQRLAEAATGGRVLPLGWTLRPNTNLLAGLASVDGTDDLRMARHRALLAHAGLRPTVGPSGAWLDSHLVAARCAASVVAADRPVTGPGLRPIEGLQGPHLFAARVQDPHPLVGYYPRTRTAADAGDALAVLGGLADDEVAVEGRPTGGQEGIGRRIAAHRFESPNRLVARVTAPAPGWLVVRESADAGWRARLDGERVQWSFADGAFMAVPVGAGPHELVMEYRPPWWTPAVGFALLALLGLGALAVRALAPRARAWPQARAAL